MKILLTLFVLFFSSLLLADDISDFQIEGMSIGDSLLDYTSKKNILDWKEKSNRLYSNYDGKYFEVYVEGEFENYDYLSFFIKSDDGQYLILAIYGAIEYNNINECYKKYAIINNEFSSIYKNAKINSETYTSSLDPSGKSIVEQTTFIFNNGDVILIQCFDIDESAQKGEFPNPDSLTISLNKKEIYSWLRLKD